MSATVQQWDNLVKGIGQMMNDGIGLKCPFCGAVKVRQIGSGILEVDCGTRIAIKPNKGSTKNVVTLNAHAVGFHHTPAELYPYLEYDCKA